MINMRYRVLAATFDDALEYIATHKLDKRMSRWRPASVIPIRDELDLTALGPLTTFIMVDGYYRNPISAHVLDIIQQRKLERIDVTPDQRASL